MEEFPRNLREFEEQFATEQACRDYLFRLRWPEGFRCPRCSGDRWWPVRSVLLECGKCGRQTSVTAGTIFQDTRKPLTDWFRAMYWVTTQKNGASALGQPQPPDPEQVNGFHADVRPASPAKPGREARQDNEYERRGTANIFCAVEPKAGRHFTSVTPDRSGFEFAKVAFELALRYPAADTIHLILDNLNIHRRKSLTDLLGNEVGTEVWNRFTVHYTPTHGSWLNQAEIQIGMLARQCLGRRRIPDLTTLQRETCAWNRRVNRARVKINWKFDRRAARRKFHYKRKSSTRSKT